ncbi:hypothetical protein OUZ56_012876 [Daphnia magna]|uniref:Uncharacterized protein n=1 Tax=Daphnia magna TaxID=35525 RepID=A0ABQ9Z4A6_9CRUS|nr:hypothetical protein OUZ56_012876 [Daphnia magna]
MEALSNFIKDLVYSGSSRVVHVTNGSNETVRVTIKDNGINQQETCATLKRGEIIKHQSTGLANDYDNITVCVRVEFNNGHVWISTHINRSVIITPKNRLIKAKCETWYQGNDSSVWRDQNDKCYKPSCNDKGNCKC